MDESSPDLTVESIARVTTCLPLAGQLVWPFWVHLSPT